MKFREAQALLHPETVQETSGSGANPKEALQELRGSGEAEKLPLPMEEQEGAAGSRWSRPETAAGEPVPFYDGGILPIGQVDKCYIVAQDSKGLYIVDQHAAHERILFDKLSAMADGIPSQQLLVHLVLGFDATEAELVEENRELFGSLGFALEPSGPQEFRLTEVPSDVPAGEAEDAIREILVGLREMHRVSAKEIRHQVLATTACRAAIKAGDELSFRQMQIVLEELAATDYPYTCPHGRPTILKFSSEELAKMFKRTGF